jgi:hypothetical protein
VDDIGGHRQVVIEELGRRHVVGDNATDFCRRQKNRMRLFLLQPTLNILLAGEVEICAINREDLAV